jgi:Flp pilus assembly CpaE family ATPase
MLRVLEMAREAVHFVGVDLGFVKVAEWAKVLNSADTLLLVAEPRAPALEMLERFLKGMKSAGLDSNPFRIVINRSRQNDDDSIQKSERELKQTFFARQTIVPRSATQSLWEFR